MTWSIAALDSPVALAELTQPVAWPSLSRDDLADQAPDVSLTVRDDAQIGARCSLWWRDTPELDGQRIGAIGHYAAASDEAARTLLDDACRRLAHHGCVVAVGPMDGNTWRKYRFVTERGSEPPFLMEPTNPGEWPLQFEASGFTQLATYSSALNPDLSVRDPRMPEVAARMTERGVTLRPFRLDDFEGELHRIYFVAEQAFTQNFLYSPITETQFTRQYRASKGAIVPQLVLIAEQGQQPVGFCFSIPDLLEKARSETVRTVILKTVAILPDRTRYGGLGSLMIDRTHETAAQLGFTRVIHALMHESNQSRQISNRTSHTMRRYTLFSRVLTDGAA